MEDPSAVEVHAALANETRLQILELLAGRGQGGIGASELVDSLDVTKPSLSRHLGILCDAELVNATRTGRRVNYTLQAEPLRKTAERLTDLASRGSCEPGAGPET